MWPHAFEEHGFAFFPGLLAHNEIATLLEDLLHLPMEHGRAGIRHALSYPSIYQLAHDGRLLSVVRQIVGREALPFRATLFNKSPAHNWLIPWHQDTALPLCERRDIAGWGPWSMKDGVLYAHAPANALEQVVALRIHLDDSTLHNGPLRVLPGTHKLGVLNDDEVQALATNIAEVNCIVAKGGVLAMRPLIIHSSSKAQNGSARRVLHVEYVGSLALSDGMHLAVT